MGGLANAADKSLTRRAVLQGAAAAALAMAARPVLGQQVPMQTHLPPGVEPKAKGPLVFLDYDQEELDLAYDQPHGHRTDRRYRDAWPRRTLLQPHVSGPLAASRMVRPRSKSLIST